VANVATVRIWFDTTASDPLAYQEKFMIFLDSILKVPCKSHLTNELWKIIFYEERERADTIKLTETFNVIAI
jgi:hypothetical protein